ncbi:MAG: enoyl-CoA hydratase/isomerase family protein [Burkholderiales bacterium]|nr:enoyl-CoA hydratase/isomerase family protein [Burkholderiales bacterium]
MNPILIERHDGWAELVLNRPERKNAIEGSLAEAMRDALGEINADDAIRAVVLRGAGGAFCSGLDVKAFNADPAPPWAATFRDTWDEVHCRLIESPKVIVGALERYAINGGAALAIACDLLVAGEGAFLQVGEVQIGMAAPKNIAWLVLRHGEAAAARMCLLGDRLDARAMLREGIASEVVDDAAVTARAGAIAARIAGFPPHGVPRIKTALRAAAAGMRARDWFAAAAAHDPLAATAAPVRPSSMRKPG